MFERAKIRFSPGGELFEYSPYAALLGPHNAHFTAIWEDPVDRRWRHVDNLYSDFPTPGDRVTGERGAHFCRGRVPGAALDARGRVVSVLSRGGEASPSGEPPGWWSRDARYANTLVYRLTPQSAGGAGADPPSSTVVPETPAAQQQQLPPLSGARRTVEWKDNSCHVDACLDVLVAMLLSLPRREGRVPLNDLLPWTPAYLGLGGVEPPTHLRGGPERPPEWVAQDPGANRATLREATRAAMETRLALNDLDVEVELEARRRAAARPDGGADAAGTDDKASARLRQRGEKLGAELTNRRNALRHQLAPCPGVGPCHHALEDLGCCNNMGQASRNLLHLLCKEPDLGLFLEMRHYKSCSAGGKCTGGPKSCSAARGAFSGSLESDGVTGSSREEEFPAFDISMEVAAAAALREHLAVAAARGVAVAAEAAAAAAATLAMVDAQAQERHRRRTLVMSEPAASSPTGTLRLTHDEQEDELHQVLKAELGRGRRVSDATPQQLREPGRWFYDPLKILSAVLADEAAMSFPDVLGVKPVVCKGLEWLALNRCTAVVGAPQEGGAEGAPRPPAFLLFKVESDASRRRRDNALGVDDGEDIKATTLDNLWPDFGEPATRAMATARRAAPALARGGVQLAPGGGVHIYEPIAVLIGNGTHWRSLQRDIASEERPAPATAERGVEAAGPGPAAAAAAAAAMPGAPPLVVGGRHPPTPCWRLYNDMSYVPNIPGATVPWWQSGGSARRSWKGWSGEVVPMDQVSELVAQEGVVLIYALDAVAC